jgi:hypothetical protein
MGWLWYRDMDGGMDGWSIYTQFLVLVLCLDLLWKLVGRIYIISYLYYIMYGMRWCYQIV